MPPPHPPLEDEPILIPRIGGSNLGAYAERRRRPTSPIGKGQQSESKAAIEVEKGRTVVCMREGCSALLDYASTRRQIILRGKREEREACEGPWEHKGPWIPRPGEGCSAETCTKVYRPEQHLPRQRQRIRQVAEGERTMVMWPEDTGARVMWMYGPESVQCALKRARKESALAIARDNRKRRERGMDKWYLMYLPPPTRENAQRRARADHLRLYTQGIEPNPGPPAHRAPGYPPPPTRATHPALCPDGHANARGIGSTGNRNEGRREYICQHVGCGRHFTQKNPANISHDDDRQARWKQQRGTHKDASHLGAQLEITLTGCRQGLPFAWQKKEWHHRKMDATKQR